MTHLETEPKEVADAKLDLEQIIDYLIQEGNWLEEQILSENASKYQKCPVCSAITISLKVLKEALINTILQVDVMKENNLSEKAIAAIIDRDRRWYEASKSSTLHIFESAHKTFKINQAHPELKKQTRNKKKDPNRKKQRQAQKIARKKNKNS
jgi:hypothetical protein